MIEEEANLDFGEEVDKGGRIESRGKGWQELFRLWRFQIVDSMSVSAILFFF